MSIRFFFRWHGTRLLYSVNSKQNILSTEIMKTLLKFISAPLLALALFSSASAAPITGSIGFTGSFSSNNPNLLIATTITFGTTYTLGVADGSFSAIPNLTTVTTPTNLLINQPGVALPVSPIWQVGGFSLTLNSLIETPGNTSAQYGVFGLGSITGNGFDATPGTWIGTFNNQGTNFTFSASSTAVPDSGASVALLGLSLLGLGIFARRSKLV